MVQSAGRRLGLQDGNDFDGRNTSNIENLKSIETGSVSYKFPSTEVSITAISQIVDDGTTSALDLSISSIPVYDELRLDVVVADTGGADNGDISMTVNNNTSQNYSYNRVQNGTSQSVGGDTSIPITRVSSGGQAHARVRVTSAELFDISDLTIPISSRAGGFNGTGAYGRLLDNDLPVTSVQIFGLNSGVGRMVVYGVNYNA